jgi:hypothetical protein
MENKKAEGAEPVVMMPWERVSRSTTNVQAEADVQAIKDAILIPNYDAQPYARGAGQSTVQKRSVNMLRKWSRNNPWIRAAINLRRQQISRARWDIVTIDGESQASVEIVHKIKHLLRDPNTRMDSWRSFIEPVVEDILVLDQGCIEKELTVGARAGRSTDPIKNLWPKDGSRIAFDPAWDGSNLKKPRYFEYDDTGKVVADYKNEEMVVIVANKVTYSPLGLSPLEVLAETIEADLRAAKYNNNIVEQATPPGIIDLGEGVRPDQVDAFKSYWEGEIAGKSQTAITGGGKGVKWIPMAQSNRDMQFMEWQIYLARKICAVFGVQPQDIGLNFDVNKSTSEYGAAFTADNGIAPLCELIADYITREIVWLYDRNLRFVYTDVGRESAQAVADYYKAALAGLPWLRLNDALKERGQDAVGDLGNEIWLPSPLGYMPLRYYELYLKSKVGDPDQPAPPTIPDAPEGAVDDSPGAPKPPSKPDQGKDQLDSKPNPDMNARQQSGKKSAVIIESDNVLDENCPAHIIDELDMYIEAGVEIIAITRSKESPDLIKDLLGDFGIPVADVIRNTFPDDAALHFKRYESQKVERDGYNVVAFYDTDEQAARAYSSSHPTAKNIAEVEIENADGINLDVPSGVKSEAQKGLDWRREFGRGGIGPGQQTARMLVGNKMTVARVRKMRSYLARHEVDKKGEGWAPGQKGFPSAGRIAWALWGGDAGKAWSNKVMRSVESREANG